MNKKTHKPKIFASRKMKRRKTKLMNYFVNPFKSNVPFLYPLKKSGNSGYRNEIFSGGIEINVDGKWVN